MRKLTFLRKDTFSGKDYDIVTHPIYSSKKTWRVKSQVPDITNLPEGWVNAMLTRFPHDLFELWSEYDCDYKFQSLKIGDIYEGYCGRKSRVSNIEIVPTDGGWGIKISSDMMNELIGKEEFLFEKDFSEIITAANFIYFFTNIKIIPPNKFTSLINIIPTYQDKISKLQSEIYNLKLENEKFKNQYGNLMNTVSETAKNVTYDIVSKTKTIDDKISKFARRKSEREYEESNKAYERQNSRDKDYRERNRQSELEQASRHFSYVSSGQSIPYNDHSSHWHFMNSNDD